MRSCFDFCAAFFRLFKSGSTIALKQMPRKQIGSYKASRPTIKFNFEYYLNLGLTQNTTIWVISCYQLSNSYNYTLLTGAFFTSINNYLPTSSHKVPTSFAKSRTDNFLVAHPKALRALQTGA